MKRSCSNISNKLDKAKIGLMLQGSVFLSTIAFSVKVELSEEYPTAATNGLFIKFNPNFVDKLNIDELIGVFAHEVWHIAFDHLTRRGDRDPQLWNKAGDYVINLILRDAGFKLPEGALLNKIYKNMSTDEVYNLLIDHNTPDLPMVDIIEPDTKEGIANREEDIKKILVKASQMSKMSGEEIGDIPGEIKRVIDELTQPKLNWIDILYKYVNSTNKNDFSWRKPNRRFFPDLYLPSLYSENISNITVAIDTSGSISTKFLGKMLSELDYIYKLYKPTNFKIIDCDYVIHNIHEVDEFTEIESLNFTGYGGTSFEPVLNYCDNNPTNLLIYFTDLYGDIIPRDTEYPVLWICYSQHPPHKIGETIYCEL